MNVTTEDYNGNLSPSAVYAQIGAQSIKLQARQNVQWVGKNFTTLKYQIFGPEGASLNLMLSSYPGNAPTVINVNLLPCAVGFELSSNTSSCVCSEFYQ